MIGTFFSNRILFGLAAALGFNSATGGSKQKGPEMQVPGMVDLLSADVVRTLQPNDIRNLEQVVEEVALTFWVFSSDQARFLAGWFKDRGAISQAGYNVVQKMLNAELDLCDKKMNASERKQNEANARAKRSEKNGRSLQQQCIHFDINEATKTLTDLRAEKGRTENINTGMGWCATGVHKVFKSATGIDMRGDGYEWSTNMKQLILDKYIRCYEAASAGYDFTKAPHGSVLVWDKLRGKAADAYKKYCDTIGKGDGISRGHVAIVIGNYEVSDYITARGRQRRDWPMYGQLIQKQVPDWIFLFK